MISPILQLTRQGLKKQPEESEIDLLREEFAANHFLKLPQFIEPEILDFVWDSVKKSGFVPDPHEGGTDVRMLENPALDILKFLLNDAALFRLIENITDTAPLHFFNGRIYRIIPGTAHYHTWHDDMDGLRMIAFSLNLSDGTYEGGVLQIRNADTKTCIREIPNTGLGDAVLFRISDDLEHQVTRVTGRTPKTAFAGWFECQEDGLSWMDRNKWQPLGRRAQI